jgi:hypothetical protein
LKEDISWFLTANPCCLNWHGLAFLPICSKT